MNSFYFQLKIEDDYSISDKPVMDDIPTVGGIKVSIGFCRTNFDLNKHAVVENKGKDYWVLDLFDGEWTCSRMPQYKKFMDPRDHFEVGDIVGCKIDMDNGEVTVYKNGYSLGVAFREDPKIFRL